MVNSLPQNFSQKGLNKYLNIIVKWMVISWLIFSLKEVHKHCCWSDFPFLMGLLNFFTLPMTNNFGSPLSCSWAQDSPRTLSQMALQELHLTIRKCACVSSLCWSSNSLCINHFKSSNQFITIYICKTIFAKIRNYKPKLLHHGDPMQALEGLPQAISLASSGTSTVNQAEQLKQRSSDQTAHESICLNISVRRKISFGADDKFRWNSGMEFR